MHREKKKSFFTAFLAYSVVLLYEKSISSHLLDYLFIYLLSYSWALFGSEAATMGHNRPWLRR